MKKRKKKILRYSKERAVLSDVLPYETPITFSNRHFYNFINENKFQINGNKVSWSNPQNTKWNIAKEELIKILFDLKKDAQSISPKFEIRQKNTIPFGYRITHKENDYRELAVPHPKTQLELVSFYEKYKELILYYSSVSPFSIRKPHSVAKFVFKNDSIHKKNTGDNDDIVESHDKEYENLKTFFTYKKYSNIYQFYEDYRYHRAEKKYNKMLKFDIAKCFDSIYTHSISWAIFNKEIIKDNLLNKEIKTFSDNFDGFMQSSNYGETNGILIGPEFSRIFAELILQQIDKSVELELRQSNLYFKKDYEIYRYVDDFFVFYNTDEAKDKILSLYKLKLKEYKLSFNNSKTILFEKPLITDLTIGKERVIELFDNKIKFKIEKPDNEEVIFQKLNFQCNSNKLITQFKIIIKESNVEYKDIMNYTLAIISKRIERSINKFEKYYSKLCRLENDGELTEEQIKIKIKHENLFSKFIIELLDFTFFLYSVSPKVNSTIKTSSILSIIIKYLNGKYRYKDNAAPMKKYVLFDRFHNSSTNKELIFKKIADEINLIISSNKIENHVQIENLYLLIILGELGKNFYLTEQEIIKYFDLNDKNKNGELSLNFTPNYFTITVLLFYIRNNKLYDRIKAMLKKAILSKIGSIDQNKRRQTTENILLFFDVLSCPFLDNKFKKEVLRLFDIEDNIHSDIINFKKTGKYWFTKWDNFNLAKELSAKKSLEVYS